MGWPTADLCGEVIKVFRRNAPDQMRVLDEFRRRRWPRNIDFTSITGDLGMRGRRAAEWVENTVGNLNRGLTHVRFHMDCKARMVRWEPTE